MITQKLRSIDVEPIVDKWRENYQIDVRPQFRDLTQIESWRCEDCFIFFFAPEFLAGSAEIYSQLDIVEGYYTLQKWEFEVALEDLAGCKTVLEVGSGSGSFILKTKERLGVDVEGLEQNKKAIADSVSRGLRVREATVEEVAKSEPAIYDAVCSFQVLEHVQKPGQFLEACCSLLRPGGRLLLGLPNMDSYLRHLFNPLDMPPHHMTRWGAKSLDRLQKFFPLRLVRVAYEPIPEDEVEWFVAAYEGILRRVRLGFLVHPWIRSRAIRLIRRQRYPRSFLHGQTIYAHYTRT